MARTGENIYKRRDGRWEARYILTRDGNNKPRYRSVYGKTYAEVKRKLTQEKLSILTAKEFAIESDRIFKVLAMKWLHSRIVKESTFARYSELLRQHIIPYWKDRPIGEISTVMLEQYISALLKNGRLDGKGGLSHKTVADILIPLKSIFNYAHKTGCPLICDWKGIAVPKGGREMRVFSKQEQRKLTKHLLTDTDPSRLGVLLCLFTGIRIGELCALKGEHIDLSSRTLRIRATMQRIKNLSVESEPKTKIVITSPKSKKSARDIPIPKSILPFLRELAVSSDAYLLTGSSDHFIEPRTMQNRFKAYLSQCKIKDTNFHALRHTFSTNAIEQGFDVKSLSEILGHANVNVTLNLYVHSSFALKRKHMDKMTFTGI